MRETSLVTHHASRIRGCQLPEFLKNQNLLAYHLKAPLPQEFYADTRPNTAVRKKVRLIRFAGNKR